MSVKNPEEFWKSVSAQKNWRDYILPGRSDEQFEQEGSVDTEKMYYFFDKNSLVVDYGCGIGRNVMHDKDRAKKVIGLDINVDFLEKAKKYIQDNNVSFYKSTKYLNREVADFVYSLMVLQHNDELNRKIILNHIHSLLKDGGIALIQFPQSGSDYYEETEFVHKFTKEEVIKYGKIFSQSRIVEGNLANYANKIDMRKCHEYFLIVSK